MEKIPQIMSAIEIGDDGSTASLKLADTPIGWSQGLELVAGASESNFIS